MAISVTVTPSETELTGGFNGDITIQFSEPVTGFNRQDLELVRYDGFIPTTLDLIAAGVSLTKIDGDTAIVNGLENITKGSGFYFLRLVAEDSGIQAVDDGEALVNSGEGSWITDNPAPEVRIITILEEGEAFGPTLRNTAVEQIGIAFDEVVENFDISDLKLLKNGVAVDLTGISITPFEGSTTAYLVSGLDNLTGDDGRYEFRVIRGDIEDTDGNKLLARKEFTWRKGTTATPLEFDFGPGFNTILGTDAGEALTGTAQRDIISGGNGNDSIKGLEKSDYILGGDGNDILKGGAGKDGVDGGEGNDTLKGGDGSDFLYGNAGNDSLFGGAGVDMFLLDTLIDGGGGSFTAAGVDTVNDFTVGEDLLDLRNAIATLDETSNFNNAFEAFVLSVRRVQVGANTDILIDTTGSGTGVGDELVKVATLLNVTASTLKASSFVTDLPSPVILL